jgi:hypothetical protein
MTSTTLAVIVFAGFVIGEVTMGMILKKTTRRKLKCALGFHGLSTAQIKDDGRVITQRCLYCDKVINMYERDEENTIRRVR